MDLMTGAMGNLGPKLLQLLQGEYKPQKSVRAEVESLSRELDSMRITLSKVAEVPHEHLDPQVSLWARAVREASYDMEDILDTFLVRVEGDHQSANVDKAKIIKRLQGKMGNLFSIISKVKARHKIAGTIENIKKQVEEMTRRRDRYKVDSLVANPVATTSIDPRLWTSFTKVSELVGIGKQRDALIEMLSQADDNASDKEMKIVSVFGSGGLGKTTLAKAVYEKLTIDMNISYRAFVPVGQKPDLAKVFRNILLELDKQCYMSKCNFIILDERQLIYEIREFLKEKRYFIVIDDIWEVSSWNKIRICFDDNDLGNKIILTTRRSDVAEKVCSYNMKPLLPESSEILFYGRIFGSKDKCPEQLFKISQKILRKCRGVPLAIITIASLLARKSRDTTDEWQEVCKAIGSGVSSSDDMCNMRDILSLSYYDLPSHMKTCFLYLSIYPEDYDIMRDQLIWMWIAEGFIQPKKEGDNNLFELGQSYFNEFINRSLVMPLGSIDSIDGIYGCHVHDIMLDLICSLSREENFVTTSDAIVEARICSGNKLRRLSIRNATWPKADMSQVRSIAVFVSYFSMPSISSFGVLRVLNLEGHFLKDSGRLNKLSVGSLIHLRYLRVRQWEQVEGIEKLKFLQVLKFSGRTVLPAVIFELKQLMCLDGILHPRPGNLLENLSSLQVFSELLVDQDSAGAVEGLGLLTQLRELRIRINMRMDQILCDSLISSLGKMPKLQILKIFYSRGSNNNLIKWECWAAPQHLCILKLWHDESLQTLPKWISPASLPHLTHLFLKEIDHVRPEDIQILGLLPSLCQFTLTAVHGNSELQRFVVSADAFPHTTWCQFMNVIVVPSVFPRGAMPKVESLQFCLRASDFFQNGGFDLDDLALGHLPSLRGVGVRLLGSINETEEVTRVKQALVKAQLRHAVNIHPNHPSLTFLG
ncbi:unnamed protein product [Urochloa decumbens]|uniref:AAA+ ATPase domain-containing protein n=2 Tax=Urochloa decumbens TaxID=240449 RepID=A0ABC9EMB6_9POAL